MLNINTDKNNIAKYKEILLLSDLSEQYSKDIHNLKQVLSASPYFIPTARKTPSFRTEM